LGEIANALAKEGEAIRAKIPPGSRVAALCVEGRMRSSEEIPQMFPVPGRSPEKHMVFIIQLYFYISINNFVFIEL